MQDRQVAEICQTNRLILITINLECSKWVNLSAAKAAHLLNTPFAARLIQHLMWLIHQPPFKSI